MKFYVIVYRLDTELDRMWIDLNDPEYDLCLSDKHSIARALVDGEFTIVPWQFRAYWDGELTGECLHMLLSVFE